ncbi:MAG: metallophosphoesterase [bacterium]
MFLERDPMRYLHCSDVHITQDYSSVPLRRMGWRRILALLELHVGGRATDYANAQRTLEQIVCDADLLQVDQILLTGDLTGYGTELEFHAARVALGRRAVDRESCLVIPGNHDAFTPKAVHSGRFERTFGHLLSSDLPELCREGPYPFVYLKRPDVAIIGLLSARLAPVPGLAYGRVGPAQLDALREILARPELANRAVLVLVHHAPYQMAGNLDSRAHGLRDATELLHLLPGPRFALLHGHIHHRFHHPPTATRPHIFCAGSSTQRGREGYWIIDTADGRITNAAAHVPQLRLTR